MTASHYSREVSDYFHLEARFQNFETSFEKFGAIMATGVWNDTKAEIIRRMSVTRAPWLLTTVSQHTQAKKIRGRFGYFFVFLLGEGEGEVRGAGKGRGGRF